MTYTFLQHYWWFIVSLLGALLVFLMFVQGANSLSSSLAKNDMESRMILNSTGRKWEITFTTLVTFGGAFFASFPLFYSTSFGGAYWLWMLILFTFVVQAVSYEFQNKLGNILGRRTFNACLYINGVFGPFLLGVAVATFFNGANFTIEKGNLTSLQPIISSWANDSYGLDALLDPWNILFGLAVLYLVRSLGILYLMNNIEDENIRSRGSVRLVGTFSVFLVLFIVFIVRTLMKEGLQWNAESGTFEVVSLKYLHNLLEMWYLLIPLALGLVSLLYGVVRTIISKKYIGGIWYAGIGVVLVVLVLLLCAGWNNTAYYPSLADVNSSLTISNSCSSEFTLRTMFYVSLLVPFVLAYIVYVWRAMDRKKITKEEMSEGELY
ncbi:MAG: cytochrome d ubiquinol oxidase subunit II [Prevotella sp.]|nr:cytochrome d ubiquinol oxidase subunit II [Prevotella sp.]MDD6393462.1 cytochrome d ubiquinol oxidase subunit II [Prevotella sp.]